LLACHTTHTNSRAIPSFAAPLTHTYLLLLLGKEERTRDFVLDGMKQAQQAMKDDHNLIANMRLETYEGERYFHVPPPTDS